MRFVTRDIAKRTVLACAEVLVRLLQEDGRFTYRYRVDGRPVAGREYSETRHIGAVWFLLEVEKSLGPINYCLPTALQAAQYMREHCLVPFAGYNMRAVVEEGYIRLGGSALAINVLCCLHDITKTSAYLDDAGRLAEFILEQQQATGDFIQARQYPLSTAHPMRDPFSAGQAVLGLVYLYERTGDPRLINAAIKAIKFLDTANYGVQSFSHWMLYALDKLYEHTTEPRMLAYAERIGSRMLADTEYRRAGLSTPIACRTEGLLAYDRLLAKAGVDSADPRRSEVMRHVRQNLSSVFKYRAKDGAFVEGHGKPEVRIDFIVHPGRACLAYAMQSIDRR